MSNRSADRYIGMELAAAILLCQESGISYRITKQDGEAYMLTMDLKLNRLNFEVENGIIVKAKFG